MPWYAICSLGAAIFVLAGSIHLYVRCCVKRTVWQLSSPCVQVTTDRTGKLRECVSTQCTFGDISIGYPYRPLYFSHKKRENDEIFSLCTLAT